MRALLAQAHIVENAGELLANAVDKYLQALVTEIASTSVAELADALFESAVGFFLFGLLLGTFLTRMRNLPVRRSASGQLYVTGFKLTDQIYRLLSMVRINGKRFGEVAQGEPINSMLLPINAETEALLRGITYDLDVVREYLLNYEYAFNRRVRQVSLGARDYAISVRKFVDKVLAEMERRPAADIDLLSPRFYSAEVTPKGLSFVPPTILLERTVDLTFLVAEALEGRFLFLFPADGRTAPRNVRRDIQSALRIARRRRVTGTAPNWF